MSRRGGVAGRESMNVYAYCLSERIRAETIDGGVGVAGAKPRLLLGGHGIVAVVSDFEDARISITRENVRAHSETIGRVLAQTTPLPFRFGTIVSAAQIESYLASRRAEIEASLAHVSGCVEMGVKIIRDPATAGRSAEPSQEGSESGGPEGGRSDEAGTPRSSGRGGGSALKEVVTPGPGAAFLLAKRRAILGEESLKTSADEIVAWLDAAVRDTVRDTRVRLRPMEALVVRAAHLVERRQVGVYRARLEAALGTRRGGDLRFLTSGAWPPYSFTDLESQTAL